MDADRLESFHKLFAKRMSRRNALRAGGGVVAASAAAAMTTLPAAAQDAPVEAYASWKQPQGGTPETDFDAAIAQLDGVVADIHARSGVPGIAVGVVHQDQVVYLKGFGTREIGTDQPVDADTIFLLASVSKPLGSTVVAGLVGDGHLAWRTPISHLTPEFEMSEPWVSREITVLDMYCHRGGWPEHAGDLLEDNGYNREQVLHRMRYQQPYSSFRSLYNYTNFGMTAGGVAAATAAGSTWEDISQTRLYDRLGMTRTSSRFSDYINSDNRAHGHWEKNGPWELSPQRDPEAQSPAGGASSSARDMAEWMRLQLAGGMFNGEQVVDSAALAETHRPQIMRNATGTPESDRDGFYGLGWNVGYDDHGRTRLGHSGAFLLGAATAVYMIPAEQFGIVVLTNGWPLGVPEAISLSFQDLVLTGTIQADYFAILEEIFRGLLVPAYASDVDLSEPPADAHPPLGAEAYTGVFLNDLNGPIEVADEGGLVLKIGPEPKVFELMHYDRDVFAFMPTGENGYTLSAVTFTVGDDGIATKVTIRYFDVFGQGTFWREMEEPAE